MTLQGVRGAQERDHLAYIAKDLRHFDRLEVDLLHPGEDYTGVLVGAVERSLAAGGEAYLVLRANSGIPIGVIGVKPVPNGGARPWALGTTDAAHHARAITTGAKWYTDRWAEKWGVLANACLSTNVATKRWLRAIGFKLDPEPLLHAGHPWTAFYKYRPTK
jgi:hypothetical protein